MQRYKTQATHSKNHEPKSQSKIVNFKKMHRIATSHQSNKSLLRGHNQSTESFTNQSQQKLNKSYLASHQVSTNHQPKPINQQNGQVRSLKKTGKSLSGNKSCMNHKKSSTKVKKSTTAHCNESYVTKRGQQKALSYVKNIKNVLKVRKDKNGGKKSQSKGKEQKNRKELSRSKMRFKTDVSERNISHLSSHNDFRNVSRSKSQKRNVGRDKVKTKVSKVSKENDRNIGNNHSNQLQVYEKIPLYAVKSNTNSDIQFSNFDDNSVKNSTNQVASRERNSKFSKRNLYIDCSSNYLISHGEQCLMEHSQPRGIRNHHEIFSEAAIKIQKVFRGYLTRKMLRHYLEEEEQKLIKQMHYFRSVDKGQSEQFSPTFIREKHVQMRRADHKNQSQEKDFIEEEESQFEEQELSDRLRELGNSYFKSSRHSASPYEKKIQSNSENQTCLNFFRQNHLQRSKLKYQSFQRASEQKLDQCEEQLNRQQLQKDIEFNESISDHQNQTVERSEKKKSAMGSVQNHHHFRSLSGGTGLDFQSQILIRDDSISYGEFMELNLINKSHQKGKGHHRRVSSKIGVDSDFLFQQNSKHSADEGGIHEVEENSMTENQIVSFSNDHLSKKVEPSSNSLQGSLTEQKLADDSLVLNDDSEILEVAAKQNGSSQKPFKPHHRSKQMSELSCSIIEKVEEVSKEQIQQCQNQQSNSKNQGSYHIPQEESSYQIEHTEDFSQQAQKKADINGDNQAAQEFLRNQHKVGQSCSYEGGDQESYGVEVSINQGKQHSQQFDQSSYQLQEKSKESSSKDVEELDSNSKNKEIPKSSKKNTPTKSKLSLNRLESDRTSFYSPSKSINSPVEEVKQLMKSQKEKWQKIVQILQKQKEKLQSGLSIESNEEGQIIEGILNLSIKNIRQLSVNQKPFCSFDMEGHNQKHREVPDEYSTPSTYAFKQDGAHNNSQLDRNFQERYLTNKTDLSSKRQVNFFKKSLQSKPEVTNEKLPKIRHFEAYPEKSAVPLNSISITKNTKNENMPLLVKSSSSKNKFKKKEPLSLLDRTQSLKEFFLKNSNITSMVQADYLQKMMQFREQILKKKQSIEILKVYSLMEQSGVEHSDFISQLEMMKVKFEKEKREMDEIKRDIFNGYQAILRLMKNTLIDARLMGCGIPFCRSMEVFKCTDLWGLNGNSRGSALMWQLDEVFVDELQRSKSKKKIQGNQSGIGQKESKSIRSDTLNEDSARKEEKDGEEYSQNKGLSRQASSLHQLPNNSLSSGAKHSIERDSSPNGQESDKCSSSPEQRFVYKKSKLVQPCSFDISELGECSYSYEDSSDFINEGGENCLKEQTETIVDKSNTENLSDGISRYEQSHVSEHQKPVKIVSKNANGVVTQHNLSDKSDLLEEVEKYNQQSEEDGGEGKQRKQSLSLQKIDDHKSSLEIEEERDFSKESQKHHLNKVFFSADLTESIELEEMQEYLTWKGPSKDSVQQDNFPTPYNLKQFSLPINVECKDLKKEVYQLDSSSSSHSAQVLYNQQQLDSRNKAADDVFNYVLWELIEELFKNYRSVYQNLVSSRGSMNECVQITPIKTQEIKAFMEVVHQKMPNFSQVEPKLQQKMYPSPLQLLKSLRDYDCEYEMLDEEYYEIGQYEYLISQERCEAMIDCFTDKVREERSRRQKEQLQIASEIFSSQFYEKYWNQKQSLLLHSKGRKQSDFLYRAKFIKDKENFKKLVQNRQAQNMSRYEQSLSLREEILKIQMHTILDSLNEELIHERQSRKGYSGIGNNELYESLMLRESQNVGTQAEYQKLLQRAQFRLDRLILSQSLETKDKLLIECHESICFNDSQWILYTNEALEYGLDLSKEFEEHLMMEIVEQMLEITELRLQLRKTQSRTSSLNSSAVKRQPSDKFSEKKEVENNGDVSQGMVDQSQSQSSKSIVMDESSYLLIDEKNKGANNSLFDEEDAGKVDRSDLTDHHWTEEFDDSSRSYQNDENLLGSSSKKVNNSIGVEIEGESDSKQKSFQNDIDNHSLKIDERGKNTEQSGKKSSESSYKCQDEENLSLDEDFSYDTNELQNECDQSLEKELYEMDRNESP